MGHKVKDKVIEFNGIATSISYDLYGCIQVLVHPGLREDCSLKDCAWFDANRLEIIGKKPIMTAPDFIEDKGPTEKPMFNKN